MDLYNSHFFIIRALKNMQAGAGGVNLGIIDNLVQRDVTDGLPCINDSSLKGALKEYADYLNEEQPQKPLNGFIEFVYGCGDNNRESKGSYIFPEAHLLSLPIRSSVKPFFRGTSIQLMTDWAETLGMFNCADSLRQVILEFTKSASGQVEKGKGLIFEDAANCYFEDFDLTAKEASFPVPREIQDVFGEDLVIFSKEDFCRLTDDKHLPVIPRNHLVNGDSKNLWYEQVVPREARFGFTLLVPHKDNYFTKFLEVYNNRVIQIGANASVGYGWSFISKYV